VETRDYVPPDDQVIERAQKALGVRFHRDYIAFIKSGYDLGDSILEPLQIDDPEPHVDMFEYVKEAWNDWGVPKTLLPIVHDNSDFYCIDANGRVVFWSHNGPTNETWPDIATWRSQMMEEGKST
jgi:hypothetical protein